MKRERTNAQKAGIALTKELIPFYSSEPKRFEIMEKYINMPLLSTMNMKSLAITIYFMDNYKQLNKKNLNPNNIKSLLKMADITEKSDEYIIKYTGEIIRYYKKISSYYK